MTPWVIYEDGSFSEIGLLEVVLAKGAEVEEYFFGTKEEARARCFELFA